MISCPVELRVLSVRQPWAWLIVHGVKDIENRTWSTSCRGLVLIHAPRRVDWAADTRDLLTRDEIAGLPIGGIIGVVSLVDCVTSSDSPWFEGPFGLVLRDPRPLPFRRRVGRLGLNRIPPEETALRALTFDHRRKRIGA